MPYITYHKHLMYEVRCKGCQAIIAQRRGISRQFRVDPTPDYRLLMLELRDPRDNQLVGHVTPMCARCTDKFRSGQYTQDELQALYDDDKLQWIESAVKSNACSRVEAERMAKRFADRVPTRALTDLYHGHP